MVFDNIPKVYLNISTISSRCWSFEFRKTPSLRDLSTVRVIFLTRRSSLFESIRIFSAGVQLISYHKNRARSVVE